MAFKIFTNKGNYIMAYTLIKDLGHREYISSTGVHSIRHFGLFECENCGYRKEMPYNVAASFKKAKTCEVCKSPDIRETRYRLKTIWQAMKARCYSPSSPRYKNYGARGIKVCHSWLNFENFYKDNKDYYQRGLSIDRIDKDKDYTPSNVQWIPIIENSIKDRVIPVAQYRTFYTDVHKLSVEKEPMARFSSITEAAFKTGINVSHIADVCAGHRNTAGGFYWRYDDGRVNTIKSVATKTARAVNQYAIDKTTGDLIFIKRWETAYQAEAALKNEGVIHNNIAKVCNGKRKSCGGYYWEYAEV